MKDLLAKYGLTSSDIMRAAKKAHALKLAEVID